MIQAPLCLRPVEELQPARGAHRHAERVLVGRRDVGGPRLRAAGDAGRHVQPLAVDGDRDEPGAGHPQGVPRAVVARLLDPDLAVRLQQHAGRDVERLLRAADHQDLLGVATDGARRAQILGDRLAERPVAHRIAVHHLAARGDSGRGG